MSSGAEIVEEKKGEQRCLPSPKPSKILEPCLLTLSIIAVLALFSVPVVFVIVEVRWPDANGLRAAASGHVPSSHILSVRVNWYKGVIHSVYNYIPNGLNTFSLDRIVNILLHMLNISIAQIGL